MDNKFQKEWLEIQLKIDDGVKLLNEAIKLHATISQDTLAEDQYRTFEDEDGEETDEELVSLDGVLRVINNIGWRSSSLDC